MNLGSATVGITGASGFIGRHLISQLDSQRIKYVTIGRGPSSDFQTDYSADSLAEMLTGVDALIHLAGRRMTREDDPQLLLPFVEPNVLAVGNLVKAAQGAGVTSIAIASTIAVYSVPSGLPFSEAATTHPINAYALSKLMAEQYASLLNRGNPMRVMSLRFAAVYGVGEKGTPAIMRFVNQAVEKETLKLSGNPNYVIDQLYVADAIEAILLALRQGRNKEAYNIGGGVPWTIKQIAEAANACFSNDGNIVEDYQSLEDLPQVFMDISKASTHLGWRPHFDLNAGLADMREMMTNL